MSENIDLRRGMIGLSEISSAVLGSQQQRLNEEVNRREAELAPLRMELMRTLSEQNRQNLKEQQATADVRKLKLEHDAASAGGEAKQKMAYGDSAMAIISGQLAQFGAATQGMVIANKYSQDTATARQEALGLANRQAKAQAIGTETDAGTREASNLATIRATNAGTEKTLVDTANAPRELTLRENDNALRQALGMGGLGFHALTLPGGNLLGKALFEKMDPRFAELAQSIEPSPQPGEAPMTPTYQDMMRSPDKKTRDAGAQYLAEQQDFWERQHGGPNSALQAMADPSAAKKKQIANAARVAAIIEAMDSRFRNGKTVVPKNGDDFVKPGTNADGQPIDMMPSPDFKRPTVSHLDTRNATALRLGQMPDFANLPYETAFKHAETNTKIQDGVFGGPKRTYKYKVPSYMSRPTMSDAVVTKTKYTTDFQQALKESDLNPEQQTAWRMAFELAAEPTNKVGDSQLFAATIEDLFGLKDDKVKFKTAMDELFSPKIRKTLTKDQLAHLVNLYETNGMTLPKSLR